MNNKIILLFTLIFSVSFLVFAQNETADEQVTSNTGDKPMAAGLGLEWNMNSRKNFGAALGLGFDYNLPIKAAPFSAGFNAIFSSNFIDAGSIELSGHFRWYFMEIKSGRMNWLKHNHAGFFAQADLGFYIFMPEEDTYPLFLGGLRAGYRMPLGSCFYVEPYGRIGYPFAFGLGVTGGVRFSPAGVKKFFTGGKKQRTEKETVKKDEEIVDEVIIEIPVEEDSEETTDKDIYEKPAEETTEEIDEFVEDETEQLPYEEIIDDVVEELTEEKDE